MNDEQEEVCASIIFFKKKEIMNQQTNSDYPLPYNEEIGVEYNREFLCGKILSSKIRDASKEEYLEYIKKISPENPCDHSFVKDERGWLYDVRSCAVCGQGLGTI